MIIREYLKRCFCMLLMFFFVMFNCQYVFADASIIDQGKDWLKIGNEEEPEKKGISALWHFLDGTIGTDDNNSTEGFSSLIGMLIVIGIFIIAIVGVILGIRLMFTSAEKKAQAKQALIIYLIGSVIIMAAVSIWKILISVFEGIL